MVVKFCVFETTYVFLDRETGTIIFSGKEIKNPRKSAGTCENWPTTLRAKSRGTSECRYLPEAGARRVFGRQKKALARV